MNCWNRLFILLGLLISFCIGFISCGKSNPNSFTLQGTIQNTKGAPILFVRDYPDSVVVDTILTDKNGEFKLKSVTDTLILGTLYFNNGTSSTSLFVDKGTDVKVEGDAFLPDLIHVKGGDINNDLTEFKKENKATLQARAIILDNIRKNFASNTRPPKPNPDQISKLSNLNFQLTNTAGEYIKKNPEKIASVILLQDFFKDENSIEQLDKMIESLKEPAANFSLTYELRDYITKIKSSQEGAIAPEFQLKDSKSGDINLYQYRGKYLLLSFASNDCPLCLKNRKELSGLHKKYKQEKLEILSVIVAGNNDTSKPNKFGKDPSASTAKEPIVDWKEVTLKESWSSKILSDYNIDDLPLNILIDPNGKILTRDMSTSLIQKELSKMIITQ